MKMKWTFLCYFLFPLIAFSQTDNEFFELKIVSDYTGLYSIYWRPNVDMDTYVMGSGQLSFYAPKGSFEPINLVSHYGEWNENIDIITTPDAAENRDYFFIGLYDVPAALPVKKDDEILLVTFRNSKKDCAGKIELVDEEDPLWIYYKDLINNCITCTTGGYNPKNELAVYDLKTENIYSVGGIYDKGSAGCPNLFTTDNYEVNLAPFSTFPNPASDFMKIQVKTPFNQDIKIHLTNISGQIINSSIMPKGNKRSTIDLQSMEEGVYFLHLYSKEYQVTKKVMVLRN